MIRRCLLAIIFISTCVDLHVCAAAAPSAGQGGSQVSGQNMSLSEPVKVVLASGGKGLEITVRNYHYKSFWQMLDEGICIVFIPGTMLAVVVEFMYRRKSSLLYGMLTGFENSYNTQRNCSE